MYETLNTGTGATLKGNSYFPVLRARDRRLPDINPLEILRLGTRKFGTHFAPELEGKY